MIGGEIPAIVKVIVLGVDKSLRFRKGNEDWAGEEGLRSMDVEPAAIPKLKKTLSAGKTRYDPTERDRVALEFFEGWACKTQAVAKSRIR